MRLALLCLLLGGCSRALETPSDQVSCATFTDQDSCLAAGCSVAFECCPTGGFPGCAATSGATSCPAGCPDRPCAAITDATTCDARSECYALLTFDEMCDSAGCESHFAECMTGPPICSETRPLLPAAYACGAAYLYAYDSDGEALGCVAQSECSVTP